MNAQWGQFIPFLRAITDENGYILPILLVPALFYCFMQRGKVSAQGKLFLFFLFTALGWRILYSLSMGAGTRYNQLPVVLWSAVGVLGVFGFRSILKKVRFPFSNIGTAGLILLIVGIGIGKSLHQPKPKAYIAEVAHVLNERKPGILLDYSDGMNRLEYLLPRWEIVSGFKAVCGQPVFWRDLDRFIQQKQGQGKALYVLLRQPETMPQTDFSDACRREWGFVPFREIWNKRERHLDYRLLVFTPPPTLFGMPLVTETDSNPYGLHLPETIHVSDAEKFKLNFDSIIQDNPFPRWGGVELFAQAGKCYDDRWELEITADTPQEIPVSVTLFLPNGWPVGYATTTILLKKGNSDALPAIVQRRSTINPAQKPPYWNTLLPSPCLILAEENTPLLWHQMTNIPGAEAKRLPIQIVAPAKDQLKETLFWIGSRCNGTKWLTDQLQKRNPALKVMRLEEHPVLPYSKDPRYSFLDLATLQHDPNPLLRNGKVDWKHYCAQENIPSDAVIVIALGYEEVCDGWQKAFHVDDALKSLQTFLDNVTKNAPQTKILLIAPNLPSDQDTEWANLSSNPYIYGFRWNKRHVYRRLLEGLTAVEKQYLQVTLLPSYLFVPAGKEERYPEYLPAVERYLHQMTNENGENNENPVHP